jgi:hypothetical protein
VAVSRQPPAASPSRMPVASKSPRQTALEALPSRPDSAVGSSRPQSGNLRLSADLLAAWGNQCAISAPRSEVAAAGATRPQSGTRGVVGDVAVAAPSAGMHMATSAAVGAAAVAVGVRAQQLDISGTSRPISARPGSARGGAVQQANIATTLMRSSGSFR